MYLFTHTGVQHDFYIARCLCFNSNMTGVTSKAGINYMYHSGAPEFIPVFSGWCSCCSIFSFLSSVLYIIVCHFSQFLLTIVMSVFRYTFSDYIYNLFMNHSRYFLCLEQEQMVVVVVMVW